MTTLAGSPAPPRGDRSGHSLGRHAAQSRARCQMPDPGTPALPARTLRCRLRKRRPIWAGGGQERPVAAARHESRPGSPDARALPGGSRRSESVPQPQQNGRILARWPALHCGIRTPECPRTGSRQGGNHPTAHLVRLAKIRWRTERNNHELKTGLAPDPSKTRPGMAGHTRPSG
jgi:hypothetical protein